MLFGKTISHDQEKVQTNRKNKKKKKKIDSLISRFFPERQGITHTKKKREKTSAKSIKINLNLSLNLNVKKEQKLYKISLLEKVNSRVSK